MKLCVLLSLIFSLNVLANSDRVTSTYIDVNTENSSCLGFKIIEPSDLSFLEIEYPILIKNHLRPSSVSVHYYNNGKALFSNNTAFKESSKKPSVSIVFRQNIKENDATISVHYKSIKNQEDKVTYTIESVKSLYSSRNKKTACD